MIRFSTFLLACVLGLGVVATQARAEGLEQSPGGLCAAAVQAAEQRYALPAGLLLAIAQVESGRPDAATHRTQPWPWTVQSQGKSYYFASKAEAVSWVTAAQAKGIASIDTGCLQINLFYHPNAFKDADAAFDPATNADYAARFLVSLHAATGDWQQAAGAYHSQTLALATPYRQRVVAALNGGLPGGEAVLAPPPPTRLSLLQAAFAATIDAPDAAPPTATGSDWGVLLHPATKRAERLRLRPRSHPREVLLSYAH